MQKRIVLTKGFMKDHVNKNVCRSYCHPFLTRECAHRNERVIVPAISCGLVNLRVSSKSTGISRKMEGKNTMEKRLTASPAHSLIVFWRSEVIRP